MNLFPIPCFFLSNILEISSTDLVIMASFLTGIYKEKQNLPDVLLAPLHSMMNYSKYRE
jgi:hypothetical protein